MRKFISVALAVAALWIGMGACSSGGPGGTCQPPAWLSSACSACMASKCSVANLDTACAGFEDCYCACESKMGTAASSACIVSCASSGCTAGQVAASCGVQKCASVCGLVGSGSSGGSGGSSGSSGQSSSGGGTCKGATGTLELTAAGMSQSLTCPTAGKPIGQPQYTVLFDARNSTEAALSISFLSTCSYHKGQSIPLSSTCLMVLGGFKDGITVVNEHQSQGGNFVAGSVDLVEWDLPTGSGAGSMTLTFSAGATFTGSQPIPGHTFPKPIPVMISGTAHALVAP